MSANIRQLLRTDYLVADPSLLEMGVVRDGALVFEEGRVAAVGPWAELKHRYGHLKPLFPPENRLVLPGLVNAHHHGRALDTRQVGMADRPLELWLPSFLLIPAGRPVPGRASERRPDAEERRRDLVAGALAPRPFESKTCAARSRLTATRACA